MSFNEVKQNSVHLQPNRIAVYLTSIAALLVALAPAVANFDVSSTIGIATGLAGLVTIVVKWLDGWQKNEARLAVGLSPAYQPAPKPATAPADVPVAPPGLNAPVE